MAKIAFFIHSLGAFALKWRWIWVEFILTSVVPKEKKKKKIILIFILADFSNYKVN